MMFAICIALGEVRITRNSLGTRVATAFDDIAQPLIGLLSAGDDLPQQRNAVADIHASHTPNHHMHPHKRHARS